MELTLQFVASCFYLCLCVLLLESPSEGKTDAAKKKKKKVKTDILQLSGLQNVRTLSYGQLTFSLFDLYAIGQLRNTILDYASLYFLEGTGCVLKLDSRQAVFPFLPCY